MNQEDTWLYDAQLESPDGFVSAAVLDTMLEGHDLAQQLALRLSRVIAKSGVVWRSFVESRRVLPIHTCQKPSLVAISWVRLGARCPQCRFPSQSQIGPSCEFLRSFSGLEGFLETCQPLLALAPSFLKDPSLAFMTSLSVAIQTALPPFSCIDDGSGPLFPAQGSGDGERSRR